MNYDTSLQKLFLEMMIEDGESYARVQDIYNPENFDLPLRSGAVFIKQHADEYNTLPTKEQIKAATGLELLHVPDMIDEHYQWFFKEFEGFTKQQELNRAILEAADMIEKGEYDPIEKLIRDAVQISLNKDLGTDYFEDPRARLNKLRDSNGQVSTGWPVLDRRLFGGVNRGELNIFAGPSSSGKSLLMQNLAVNWMAMKLNGVYVTLEMSEELCSHRIDSMVSNFPSKEIFKNLDDVEIKLRMVQDKYGSLRLKEMPAQSTINNIRAYLKELQIKTKTKIDFLIVDYLDLLMPVSAKVAPGDLFVKDKYVSEELRNLARELDILFVTASQLNRQAVEEIEYNHSHISGGISKINTADNVFGIFTSRKMKENGRYQLQLMKTRSSSGVGQKIDLGFDIETLRITDIGEDAQNDGKETPTEIMGKIKSGPGAKDDDDAEESVEKQSRLKDMLKNLR